MSRRQKLPVGAVEIDLEPPMEGTRPLRGIHVWPVWRRISESRTRRRWSRTLATIRSKRCSHQGLAHQSSRGLEIVKSF